VCKFVIMLLMQTSEGLKVQKILDVKIIENNEPAIEIKKAEMLNTR